MKKIITLMLVVFMMGTSSFASVEAISVPLIDSEDVTTYSLGIHDGEEFFLTKLDVKKVDLTLFAPKMYKTYKYPTRRIVSDRIISKNYNHADGYIVYTEVREQRICETFYQSVEVLGVNKNGEFGIFNLPLTPYESYYSLNSNTIQKYKLVD